MIYGAGASLLTLAPWPVQAARVLASKISPTRTLWLHNIHTGETLKQTYWKDGNYCPAGLKALNKILRDHRSGDVFEMDRRVLDLVFSLKTILNYTKPLEIISGYRSPKTNELLRKRSREVAHKSYHTKGMAIDLNFRGLALARARDAAQSLGKGGVGYYPRDGFIHVDVRGTPMHW